MTAPALDPAVLDTLRSLNRPGEPDLVEQVLTMFLEDSPARIEAMSTAIGARDAVQLQRAAHNLKGSAGNVGATELQRICQELEAIGKGGQVEGATRFFQELRDEFERVKKEAARAVSR
jgi:HPt (histidine-containing phosphotransfer) domain-containing protein